MKTSLAIVLAATALMVSVTGAAIAHPSKGVSINYPKLDVAPSPLSPRAPIAVRCEFTPAGPLPGGWLVLTRSNGSAKCGWEPDYR